MDHMPKDDLIRERHKHVGPMCTVFFENDPINVVLASRQYLYDENGVEYLDGISNVQHVGHCHPEVAKAIFNQLNLSTCNSRFLNENFIKCCEKLKEKLPPSLDTIFFCNSGSEANDLALRISFDYTDNAEDIIVVDHAYHGHLTTLIEISPYKFNGVGGRGKPDRVHIAPCPDVYRGIHKLPTDKLLDADALKMAGKKYADEVGNIFEKCKLEGRRVRAFIMESMQSCGGQIIPPPTYMERVQKYAHEAGALFIADEVQTGFGRIGAKFWAFRLGGDDFVPDVITLGKPMGNGFPVAALVTKRAVAEKFGGGMQYFNTFGGNPVSCIATMAVLDVLQKENLPENATRVGSYLLQRLRDVQACYPSLIGDVRGVGLFVGIDIVRDSIARSPDPELARLIINKLRQQQIILSVDGPFRNIIKIKPPLCFTKDNADQVVDCITNVLNEIQQTNRQSNHVL